MTPSLRLLVGDALETLLVWRESNAASEFGFDLIVTDPPYAFSGQGAEHEMTATVAIVLRESAAFLKPGGWMLVMCASSWRGTAYMVEALRGKLLPVRIATWCKPTAKTKTRTAGWAWASVNVVAFRAGKSDAFTLQSDVLDHITAAPLMNGRRAQLPPEVADWLVAPFAVPDGTLFDPFAGSAEILRAANRVGMNAIGIERAP
jgi:DNA modification methylase